MGSWRMEALPLLGWSCAFTSSSSSSVETVSSVTDTNTLETAETANTWVDLHSSLYVFKAVLKCFCRELSFTEHFAQISFWMSSWLSLWTTWQMQSLSTQTKETRKGNSWISYYCISLCINMLVCTLLFITISVFITGTKRRMKKMTRYPDLLNLTVTYLYSLRSYTHWHTFQTFYSSIRMKKRRLTTLRQRRRIQKFHRGLGRSSLT